MALRTWQVLTTQVLIVGPVAGRKQTEVVMMSAIGSADCRPVRVPETAQVAVVQATRQRLILTSC